MSLDTRAILEWMDHPLAVLDENMVMVWCNRAYCRLAGGGDTSPEDWIGRNAVEDGDQQRRGLFLRALEDKSVHRFARMSLLPGGPLLDVEVRAGAVVVEGGRRFMVISAEQVETAGGRLVTDAQIAAAGRLAAGIAHEFNNLHAGILGFLDQMLVEKKLDDETREDLETIRELARRASAITRNLMAFGARRVSIMGAVSPTVLISSALHHMQGTLDGMGVEVEKAYDAAIPGLYVDRDQIVQVLENLLQNAVDAMVGEPHKEIRIQVSQDEHFVNITVHDAGRGIPEAHLGRVFEPFFTTKGSAARAAGPDAALEGVGLGLSVCKSVVEQHGGKIELRSEQGKGTTVVVSLPKLPGFEDSEVSTEAPSSRAASDRGASSTPRLLVVDDEPAVRLLVSRTARSHGWDVTEAGSVAEAERLLREERFDTVLLDMRMPGADGGELLESLEQLPPERQPVVVVCSGALGDFVPESPLVKGVLPKPFELEELTELLRRSLSR